MPQDAVVSSIYDNDVASMKPQKFGHLKKMTCVTQVKKSTYMEKSSQDSLGEKLQALNGI